MIETPTHVYVVTHSATGVGKVGIAGLDSARIDQHRSQGWHLYRAVLLPSREAARQVERSVLRQLKIDGVNARMPADRMPQGGQSETVNLDEVSAADLWGRVVAAAGEVQTQADRSRVVLVLARMDGGRVLVVGTDQPLGASKGSPECGLGEELAEDGWLVYTANMTATVAEAALRGLRDWAAKAGVIDEAALREAGWPVPLLRNTYRLQGTVDEEFRQARIAVGVSLHPYPADGLDEDQD
ncbi:hypothetical protein [Streptomyces tendae]|uniref:GIY-YIG nuclease family protein n=1 Tax=Streptomyces tendae TaxID=1932 RepID=A0ABX6A117_STRTE|nr:hypothetical protein [Streptomyces tendae]QER90544.1 hypothetical protein F3L20_33650 [Streptomyces tendae]